MVVSAQQLVVDLGHTIHGTWEQDRVLRHIPLGALVSEGSDRRWGEHLAVVLSGEVESEFESGIVDQSAQFRLLFTNSYVVSDGAQRNQKIYPREWRPSG